MHPIVLLAILIPFLVGLWVASDAKKRGLSRGAVIGWFLGVFFFLIVFLPLYLILRGMNKSSAPKSEEEETLRVCPYCGRLYRSRTAHCPYCEDRPDV